MIYFQKNCNIDFLFPKVYNICTLLEITIMSKKNQIMKKSEYVWDKVIKLPVFKFNDIFSLLDDENYTKVLIYRWRKNKKIISLKKGIYVSSEYLNKIKNSEIIDYYIEFVSNFIYTPSYLSLEYVLSKYNILSESVVSITSISTSKTKKIKNNLGTFHYYHTKQVLYTGYRVKKRGDFYIAEASLPKALFDFLYLRKKILNNKQQIEELRLNLDVLSKRDWKELEKYTIIEGSPKMKLIFRLLYE